MNVRTACLIALAALPGLSYAQSDGGSAEATDTRATSRWGVGVAVALSDSPYAGEGVRTMPFPLITYSGDRFFFRGITAGWHLVDREGFSLDAILQGRMDGFDAKDLGVEALARNGIDRRLIEDRDDALDGGLSLAWETAAGEIHLEVLADLTDTSGGQELGLEYGYPLQAGLLTITPTIGLTWLSEDMTDYYYGIFDEEVARGVVDYAPGSASIPHIGASFVHPLGRAWAMIGNVEYRKLPGKLADSPLLESDDELSLFLGVVRGF